MTQPRLTLMLAVLIWLGFCGCAGTTGQGSDRGSELLSGVDLDPIALTRTYEQVSFDQALGNLDAVSDSWRLVPFRLSRKARVEVAILAIDGNDRGTLIPLQQLSKGAHAFVVSYGRIAKAIGEEFDFQIVLRAQGSSPGESQQVVLQGYLTKNVGGRMLGRFLEYDVDVHDGILMLGSEDFNVGGRGPQFNFIRNYTNATRRSWNHSALGPGWKHNHDIRLRVIAWGEEPTRFNLPRWVLEAEGRFLALRDVPRTDGRPRYVAITFSSHFKRVGDRWYPQRGYHSTLVETKEGFVLESLSGNRYVFRQPQRPAPTLATDRSSSTILRGMHRLGPAMDEPVRSIADRWGNTLSYEYADTREGKYLVRATDAVGREFRLRYQPPIGPARASKARDGEMAGHGRARYAHAPRRLVRVLGPGSVDLRFQYVRETGLLRRVQIGSFEERYHYIPERGSTGSPPVASLRASRYNLRSVVDGVGNATEYGYLAPGAVPEHMRSSILGLDPSDLVTRIGFADGTEARIQYEVRGKNTRSAIDPRGNVTGYVLNRVGSPIEIHRPLETVTKMRWTIDEGENDLLMISETNPKGLTTYYAYDEAGNEIDRLASNGFRTQRAWTRPFGLLLRRSTSDGYLIENSFDERGNLLSKRVVDENGSRKTEYSYNRFGEDVSQSLESGGVVRSTYDRFGNDVRWDYPGGVAVEWIHDELGRPLKKIDGDGAVSIWEYDSAGRVVKEFDPEAGWIETEYDKAGNIVKRVVDGNVFTFFYDARNRVVRAEVNGQSKHWVYDANGNVVRETDWDGTVTRRRFDALNREVDEALPASIDGGSSASLSPPPGDVLKTGVSGRGELYAASETPRRGLP